VNELQHELGRAPSIDEVGARLGVNAEQVLEAMDASVAFRMRSLDAPLNTERGTTTLGKSLADEGTDDAFDQIDARLLVARLLPILSARSQRVIELRFYENRSQTEIAELLDMSQMHVSRLLKQALMELKTFGLEQDDPW
jgi:RNA polymerase sigma-B factor